MVEDRLNAGHRVSIKCIVIMNLIQTSSTTCGLQQIMRKIAEVCWRFIASDSC